MAGALWWVKSGRKVKLTTFFPSSSFITFLSISYIMFATDKASLNNSGHSEMLT
jgi:hypothetical protein